MKVKWGLDDGNLLQADVDYYVEIPTKEEVNEIIDEFVKDDFNRPF